MKPRQAPSNLSARALRNRQERERQNYEKSLLWRMRDQLPRKWQKEGRANEEEFTQTITKYIGLLTRNLKASWKVHKTISKGSLHQTSTFSISHRMHRPPTRSWRREGPSRAIRSSGSSTHSEDSAVAADEMNRMMCVTPDDIDKFIGEMAGPNQTADVGRHSATPSTSSNVDVEYYSDPSISGYDSRAPSSSPNDYVHYSPHSGHDHRKSAYQFPPVMPPTGPYHNSNMFMAQSQYPTAGEAIKEEHQSPHPFPQMPVLPGMGNPWNSQWYPFGPTYSNYPPPGEASIPPYAYPPPSFPSFPPFPQPWRTLMPGEALGLDQVYPDNQPLRTDVPISPCSQPHPSPLRPVESHDRPPSVTQRELQQLTPVESTSTTSQSPAVDNLENFSDLLYQICSESMIAQEDTATVRTEASVAKSSVVEEKPFEVNTDSDYLNAVEDWFLDEATGCDLAL